ncbi:MAG: class I SAM-dependent methyltransferase [Myxococcota bacterium]
MPSVDPRAILVSPAMFRLFKRLVFPLRGRMRFMQEHVRPREGDRVLDVGCGLGDVLEDLPPVDYHGFDLSRAYVETARRRYGDRGRFVCAAVSELSLGELEGTCDIVLANGLLHHLGDGDARALLRAASAALRPGGRVVTYDPCYVEGQSRMARRLVSKDRGRHVRSAEGYLRLVGEVFPESTHAVYHDLLRIPYTHLVVEGTRH